MPTNQPYNANHKRWDHQGNLLPQVEYSESVRPHGEFLPAPWLPLDEAGGFYDKAVEEYYSIMPGKVLAMAGDGKVVPAGLQRKFKAAGANTIVLKYTQTDLDQKVISLQHGGYVNATDLAANTNTGWKKSEIETALRARGLLGASEGLEQFVSSPVAVAPYGYLNAMSDSDPNNPATLRNHNFNIQHRVAMLCDYVLELPWVPESKSSVAFKDLGTITLYSGQDNTFQIQFTNASYLPIAPSTMRTPWSFATDPNKLFVNKKSNLRDIKATGDYFVDDDLNRAYYFHGGTASAGAAGIAAGTSVVPTFYHYKSDDDSNIASKFACVVGPIKEGDYLKPTAKSNYQPALSANANFKLAGSVSGSFDQSELQGIFDELEANAEEQAQIIGQVLQIEKHPKGGLDLVRSLGSNLPSDLYLDKMPGDATKGLPDKLTYAGGANKVVRVNIIRK